MKNDANPNARALSRRLRLNWRGAVFLALATAVGFAAAAKGNNLLFVVFSTLLGVFIAAAVFTILGPGRLEITRVLPDSAHAYEPFSYSIRLRSRRKLLPAFALRIDDRLTHDGRPAAMQPGAVHIAVALPGEKLRGTTSAAAFQRGPATFGPITVTSEFPPGLVTYTVTFAIEDSILVYPRSGIIERRILNPYLSRIQQHELVAASTAAGEEEFAGLREFRDGDNPRRVHWKLLGRVPGQVIVKEFEDARARRGVILLDTLLPDPSDRRRRSRLERAISFSAALAEALLGEGYTLRFRTHAPEPVELALEPRRGAVQDLNLMLAGLRPSPTAGLHELVARADAAADEVFFVLAVGDDAAPEALPPGRSIVIHATEMRNLMYYAS